MKYITKWKFIKIHKKNSTSHKGGGGGGGDVRVED